MDKTKVILITIDGIRCTDVLHKIKVNGRIKKVFEKITELGLFLTNLKVSNSTKVSYPGYNELLTGYVDPLIVNNMKSYNRNKTLPEKLIRKQILNPSEILVSTSWSHFLYIYNSIKSNIKPVGWELETKTFHDPTLKSIKVPLKEHIYKPLPQKFKKSSIHDLTAYKIFKKYILKNHYRFMHLGFGHTDTYAHYNNFTQYMNHFVLAEECILDLIKTTKMIDFYSQNTYFIITTDHGRGCGDVWTEHKHKIDGSERAWAIIIGPHIKQNQCCHEEFCFVTINNLMERLIVDPKSLSNSIQ